ncbi:helix-turn-helix domain-containing protein [Streptomyces sp. RK9]|uniref:helix-turn-helix domain-containing protein n=1 Tax=Streptomyces sp. RK9 TaxID=3239284 RepID=UPI00386B97EB
MPEIARRLRHIRRHHPEGPFTLLELARLTSVSKRTLAAAESAEGTNLTLETLVKLTRGLGIRRLAYFLDEQVFQEVNAEMRRGGVVAQRAAHAIEPLGPLATLVGGILAAATRPGRPGSASG